MSNRPHQLPSLTALASFEAAARKVSFKLAAAELNVTPAAVSHQVKALELELGVSLFHRHHRGVELTEAGALLFVAIQRGLGLMSDAVAQIKQRANSAAVTIRSTTAVSAFWLTPRLAEFWKSHGHIAVSQRVSDLLDTPADSDLTIYYGDSTADDCQMLFRDRVAALAAPGFAAKYGIRSLTDLAQAPLIHLNAEDNRWTTWQSWFAALGYDGKLEAGHRVNNYAIALQASQDGMGAVLGWEVLSGHFVRSGALEVVLPDSIPAPHNVHIRTSRTASARALLLRDWLVKREHLVK